ncbi:MAG: DUF5119 domain-containing protein [Tannerellaceae bacterium]
MYAMFNMQIIIKLICITSIFVGMTGCIHEETDPYCKYQSVQIRVLVDWSLSGITPTKNESDDYVHRVSFRFFPKDGTKPFELYLEENVHEGIIEVPVGTYDLIVMNESVYDVYWKDVIRFHNINDFETISAEVCEANPNAFDFYKPFPLEAFMIDIPKMASWSIQNYVVGKQSSNETLLIPMHKLTHTCRVLATVKNLKSVSLMRGAKRGFAKRVYLASRATYNAPATLFFVFNGRKPQPGSATDGTTEYSFRSLGALPIAAEYTLGVDVIMVDGRRYIPENALDLEFNVTKHVMDYYAHQGVTRTTADRIEIPISLSLPRVDGDIGVGEWGDDDTIVIE